jgi:hypothetical protein
MKRLTLAIAVVSLGTLAASANPPIAGPDRYTVPVARSSTGGHAVIGPNKPGGAQTIFDNIGDVYPLGTYWCCSGVVVTGSEAVSGFPEYWEAAAFTPQSDATIGKIVVAMAHVSGENTFTLNLLDDDGGLPGATIASWKIKNVPDYGACCEVTMKKKLAIPVTGGTQYWLAITTRARSDSYGAWNRNDTDQANPVPRAIWCSDPGGACGAGNEVWSAINDPPALAFAVYADD